MNFYINGELIDVTLEDEKTIGDVLKSFEKTCEENKMATVAIKIDGKQVTAEDFDSYIPHPLEAKTKIEVTVISENDVVTSLCSLIEPFSDIIEDIKTIPMQLQKGEDAKANKTIAVLADIIDQFCHSATYSALFPEKFDILRIDDKNLADFFSDFSKILGDFKEALENKDSVTISDLAEYEICPRILGIVEALEKLK